MKRTLWILLTLALMAFPLVASAQSTQAYAIVNTAQLNVRTSPFAEAQLITTVTQGYTAGIVGRNADRTWYQILIPGGSGWVNASYIVAVDAQNVPITFTSTAPTHTPVAPVTAIAAIGEVNTGALNVRSVPSPFGNVPLLEARRGTRLDIIGRNADTSWYFVRVNNISGWVRSTYVNIITRYSEVPVVSNSTLPQTPTPTPSVVVATGRVDTGALNIRPVPNAFNNIPLLFVYRNTNLNIIGRTQDAQWYQVRLDSGVTGWARARYVLLTSGTLPNIPVTR